MLGFKCYHMYEVFGNDRRGRDDINLWLKLNKGEATSADIDRLFSGYDAAVDFPACSFIKEFMQKYPDAKVVYAVRDPEAWRKSVLSTIYGSRKMSDSLFGRYVIVSRGRPSPPACLLALPASASRPTLFFAFRAVVESLLWHVHGARTAFCLFFLAFPDGPNSARRPLGAVFSHGPRVHLGAALCFEAARRTRRCGIGQEDVGRVDGCVHEQQKNKRAPTTKPTPNARSRAQRT
jgi:hypothetical protein